MGILVLIIWIISLVLLAIHAWYPSRSPFAAGVFAFDLWLGLQFLMANTDKITF